MKVDINERKVIADNVAVVTESLEQFELGLNELSAASKQRSLKIHSNKSTVIHNKRRSTKLYLSRTSISLADTDIRRKI